MRRFVLIFLMMVLAMSSLVACGIDANVHDAVVAEKEVAQTSVAQLEQANKKMRSDLTEAEATIQDLKAVHPPRRFKDRAEIETWLRNDDMSERESSLTAEALLAKALEQQARALEDGYIVSADYAYIGDAEYGVWVSAVTANSNYFSWDPQRDEIAFDTNINLLPIYP